MQIGLGGDRVWPGEQAADVITGVAPAVHSADSLAEEHETQALLTQTSSTT